MNKRLMDRLVKLADAFEAKGHNVDIKVRDHKPILMLIISGLTADDVEQIRKEIPEIRHIAGA